MKLTFDIYHHGEPAAGLHSYTDTVTMEVESGNPGGDEGEFERYMRECLSEWFDGARVTPNVK